VAAQVPPACFLATSHPSPETSSLAAMLPAKGNKQNDLGLNAKWLAQLAKMVARPGKMICAAGSMVCPASGRNGRPLGSDVGVGVRVGVRVDVRSGGWGACGAGHIVFALLEGS